jgi:hypothetical protein
LRPCNRTRTARAPSAEILALGSSCASHRRSSNANSLCRQNSAGFPQILRPFKGIICGDISEFESHMLSQPVPSLGPCPARKNLRDIPAVYRDGGESLWRIFLVFRWGSNFVRQSLVANFQYPCSDLRDWVRTRMRGSDTRFRFGQAAAGTMVPVYRVDAFTARNWPPACAGVRPTTPKPLADRPPTTRRTAKRATHR